MKKTILLMSLFLLTSIMTFAVPAFPGIWKNITLDDGATVYAMLKGDETVNYFEDKDGNIYMRNEAGTYTLTTETEFQKKARSRRAARRATQSQDNIISRSINGEKLQYVGNKRCLILLVDFSDVKFQASHDRAFYDNVMNKKGFSSDDGFVGSVRDYFLDQSDGRFDLTFDVKGPYTMPNTCSFYGSNYTTKTIELVREACRQAHEDGVDFSQYDWFGDGDVDLVYVIYAGYGQATGGGTSTIWPHASRGPWISSYDKKQQRQYACSNEIDVTNSMSSTTPWVAGIGTICHEFSHCLGYPDLYDIDYSGGYGMGSWDLMCGGSYNGGSFRPAGYGATEKWLAGWLEPTQLKDDNLDVNNLKAVSEGGGSYIIYNDGTDNEFFMIENRRQTGWDTSLAGSGLLITHVDYDASVWSSNGVNNDPSHQRYTIVPADGALSSYNESTDPFPYGSRNSFTNTSTPRNTVFNANTDGTYLLNRGITDIKRNTDGTMSFKYVANTKPEEPTEREETVLHESFDKCNGRGGYNAWGTQPTVEVKPDLTGWTTGIDGHIWSGSKCALFGEKGYSPAFSSPQFTLSGNKAVITFKVAPFANDKGKTLKVKLGDQPEETFTMKDKAWSTFTINTTLNGTFRLTFESDNDSRLWFDDLSVVQTILTGIEQVTDNTAVRPADNRIYTVSGVYVGTDASALPSGIYIKNGKKFVK